MRGSSPGSFRRFADGRLLRLKARDPIHRYLQFPVVGDHGDSETISTMHRWPPSRFTCQYSMVSCSLPRMARRLIQNTLCAEMRRGDSMIEQQARIPNELANIKRVFHQKKDIHIVRFRLVCDE